MKEALKKKIVKGIVSPQMVVGIGIVTIIGTIPYATIAEDIAGKKAEQAFPHKASPEQLGQAQQAVLIFDSKVHNLISGGGPVIDYAKFTDLSTTIQAIRTIDEENVILKQRREFRQNLQKPIGKRADSMVLGGIAFAVAGAGWLILHTIRREKLNNKMPSEPSST